MAHIHCTWFKRCQKFIHEWHATKL